MTIPTWPQTLPAMRSTANTAGFDSLHPEGDETEMDDGPARQRRRNLFVTTPLNMNLLLTREQFVAFKRFHLQDLNGGVRRFSAPVLLPDMRTVKGRVCWIKRGKVSGKPNGPHLWSISFVLVVVDW